MDQPTSHGLTPPPPPIIGRHEERLPSGRVVQWQIVGNQVYLFHRDAPMTLASLPDADRVNLAARIVAFQHEQVQDPDTRFHGTALIQVADRHGTERLFIDSNGQPSDHFNRSCAESSAMLVAKRITKQSHPPLKSLYLMGHYADAPENTEQPHAMPCGHCRQELLVRSDEHSQLYSLPHASYTALQSHPLRVHTLHAADDDVSIAADDALAMPMRSLLPRPAVRLAGMEWLGVIGSAEKALQQHDITLLEAAMGAIDQGHSVQGDSLVAINRALVAAIAGCHEHGDADPNKPIRAIVVKTTDGRCFVAASPRDARGVSKPPAAVAALMQAANERNIADVYVMDYDPVHTQDQSKKAAAGSPPLLMAYDGYELDRIRKHTPKGGEINLHVLPFNDGWLNDPQLRAGMNSMKMSDAYPRAYINPKSLDVGSATR